MIQIRIDNRLTISKLPWELRDEIKRRLSFENPAFIEATRMNRWAGNIPDVLRFYEQQGTGTLVIPRGFAGQAIRMIGNRAYQLDDQRRTLPEVDFNFTGILKPFQEQAVTAMTGKDFGTLAAPTGSGKTVMAIAIIAERKQPTLITVHTKELLTQWVNRIETFLGIPKEEIGQIGAGKKIVGKRITVALVQSLCKIADEVKTHVGFLIVDEAHHCPSKTFLDVVSLFDCKFMLGLSATPYRRDGLSRLIYWYLGDCQHEVGKASLVENGDILRAEVVIRETAFSPYADPVEQYSTMLSELCSDPGRNELIVKDVIREASNGGGICLVLTDRKGHCDTLAAMLRRNGVYPDILTGDTLSGERKTIVERLNSGDVSILIATGQLVGEGFDCKGLSTLFLATPIKFSGRLIQYLGRILRPAPGKNKATVYDYIDKNVGVLRASAKARSKVYATN